MVEFFSPTCGACISVTDVVEALADTFAGTAMVAKVKVLENDSLVQAFGVTGWPTFIFFSGGIEYERFLGGTSFDILAAIIRTGLDGPVGKKRAGSSIPLTKQFTAAAAP
jgi:thioredoxin-like negative regulator of GroEL